MVIVSYNTGSIALKRCMFMTQINISLDIKSLEITAQSIDNKVNIILSVVSKNTNSTCHKCGKPATTCET